jgi:hypothetical protein
MGFFDGHIPAGSTNFTDPANGAKLGALAGGLVAFFGTALGCTDSGFPTYTGGDMKTVHSAMPIGLKEFNTFNGALLSVLRTAGMSQPDLDAVNAVLQSTKGDICNQADCKPTVPGETFVVGTAPKVNHPFVNQGFATGFVVDGTEGRELTLQVGTPYTFQSNAACIHPLYISTSADGAGAGEVTAGVTYPGGDNLGVCQGKSLVFVPQPSQDGMLLYYQCGAHLKMGYKINIGTPTTGASTASTVSTGTPNPSAGGEGSSTASTLYGAAFGTVLFAALTAYLVNQQ